MPLALLNHNTSNHASIGCERTRVFQGRVPNNFLDHKLGDNPNEQVTPTNETAEKIQKRTKLLIDKTKQNIMDSYLKYKEYYDHKARAAPLKESDFCFVLQPNPGHQGSKILFRDYRWVGPFLVQEVLPITNYIVHQLNTNNTQILHRIRLKKFVPNQPLEDRYREEKLPPDEETIILQDDLHTITWEADFGDQLEPRGNAPNPTYLPSGEQPLRSNDESTEADENEVDYIATINNLHDVNEPPQRRREILLDDVSKRNEATEATRNGNSDLPNVAVYPKNQAKFLPDLSKSQGNDANDTERTRCTRFFKSSR